MRNKSEILKKLSYSQRGLNKFNTLNGTHHTYTHKTVFPSPFLHAMLANKIIQLLIGNSHIRTCNNLSKKRLPFNLIDGFCLTTIRPEYDSFTF